MELVIRNLSKTYANGVQALKDVTLTIPQGMFGLLGPNGAGKTTTLRALAGILRPTAGRVLIGGFDVVEQPLEARRQLAFMPDEPHLFEYLTVEEHLRLVGRLYGVADVDGRAQPLMEELELLGKEQALPGELDKIADQARSRDMCMELFGRKMGFVPYIMPGFALAKAAAEVFEQDPTVEGLILDKHGIFTFGETAKDGSVTLEAVYCLGLCACSPSAMLDGEVIGRLDQTRIEELAAEVKA